MAHANCVEYAHCGVWRLHTNRHRQFDPTNFLTHKWQQNSEISHSCSQCTQDHFDSRSVDLEESGNLGLFRQRSDVTTDKRKGENTRHSVDHFAGSAMACGVSSGADAQTSLLASDGTQQRGVARMAPRGAAEKSFDHFSEGGMVIDGDALLSSHGGVGKRNVGQVQGKAMSTDHFSDGMIIDGTAGAVIADPSGKNLMSRHHVLGHTTAEDHFGRGSNFVPEEGHGHHLTRYDLQRLERSKHSKSIYEYT